MPVRKIPRSHMRVTGAFATTKANRSVSFESPLERDYMLLLEFDDRVASIEEQPVRVPVPGTPQGYVPDVLVHYHPATPGAAPEVVLVEVKHTSDLARNHDKYKAKFEAARQYAAERNWRFVIVTEQDIRTQRLQNLAFLKGYRRNPIPTEHATVIDACMRSAIDMTLGDLLAKAHQASSIAVPVLTGAAWTLIAHRRIKVDLDSPLSLATKIAQGGHA
jgi:hypothetical protein